MTYLIKSAVLYNGKGFDPEPKDILVEAGKITKIGKEISNYNAQVIDYPNLHVSPAWFDPIVSFGEPGFEDQETIENGALTALKSGFSGIGLTPHSKPIIDQKSGINYIYQAFKHQLQIHPLGAITKQHNGKDLADLHDMYNTGAVGFYDTKKAVHHANAFKVALQYATSFNALIFAYPEHQELVGNAQVHEDENTIHLGLKSVDAIAETIQIKRDLELLTYTNSRLHIPYVSCANSIEVIREAKAKGLDFTCSTSINNLYFNTTSLSNFESKYKIKPPLRHANDQKALIKAISDGTIDYVTSDHTPITAEAKHLDFENAAYGSIGLESSFGALNTLLGKTKAVNLLLNNWSMYQLKKPEIKEGQNAQITLFNPDLEYNFSKKEIYSKSKNAIFEGENLTGKVFGTLVKTELYVD